MRARFEKMSWENPARTIANFHFKPERHYAYTAGQYADITVQHAAPDSRGQTRTMTLTSSPTDELLSFAARIGSHNQSTYKHALMKLQKGDAVQLTDAMGDMVLPLDNTIPLIFVAGGVGVASYVGMIRWLLSRNERRNITLLYAVRTVDDAAFQTVFAAYAEQHSLTTVLYAPDLNTPTAFPATSSKDRLTTAQIADYAKKDAQIYLSGTEAMVEQLRTELQQVYKIPQYRLVFDYFDGYTDI